MAIETPPPPPPLGQNSLEITTFLPLPLGVKYLVYHSMTTLKFEGLCAPLTETISFGMSHIFGKFCHLALIQDILKHF